MEPRGPGELPLQMDVRMGGVGRSWCTTVTGMLAVAGLFMLSGADKLIKHLPVLLCCQHLGSAQNSVQKLPGLTVHSSYKSGGTDELIRLESTSTTN